MPRFKSSYPEHQIYEDYKCLHALGEESAAGAGIGTIEAELPGDCRAVLVHCHHAITATGDATDLIDIVVQTRFLDAQGTEHWIDAVWFTQIDGAMAAAVEMFDKICASLNQANFDPVADPIAADGKRHIIGDKWRVRWNITDGGGAGTHAFTFSVSIHPM